MLARKTHPNPRFRSTGAIAAYLTGVTLLSVTAVRAYPILDFRPLPASYLLTAQDVDSRIKPTLVSQPLKQGAETVTSPMGFSVTFPEGSKVQETNGALAFALPGDKIMGAVAVDALTTMDGSVAEQAQNDVEKAANAGFQTVGPGLVRLNSKVQAVEFIVQGTVDGKIVTVLTVASGMGNSRFLVTVLSKGNATPKELESAAQKLFLTIKRTNQPREARLAKVWNVQGVPRGWGIEQMGVLDNQRSSENQVTLNLLPDGSVALSLRNEKDITGSITKGRVDGYWHTTGGKLNLYFANGKKAVVEVVNAKGGLAIKDGTGQVIPINVLE